LKYDLLEVLGKNGMDTSSALDKDKGGEHGMDLSTGLS